MRQNEENISADYGVAREAAKARRGMPSNDSSLAVELAQSEDRAVHAFWLIQDQRVIALGSVVMIPDSSEPLSSILPLDCGAIPSRLRVIACGIVVHH